VLLGERHQLQPGRPEHRLRAHRLR
jgi:hypothetical protein